MYGGEDLKPDSGRLELRLHDGTIEIKEGFYMENLEQGGTGIESLQQFVNACRGKDYKIGADHDVGLEAADPDPDPNPDPDPDPDRNPNPNPNPNPDPRRCACWTRSTAAPPRARRRRRCDG